MHPAFSMTSRPLLLLLLLLAAAGCQGNPQVRRVVDSVQAEARQLEDIIYLKEQDIQVLEQKIAKLQRRIDAGEASPRRPVRPEQNPDLEPPLVEPPGEMPEPPPNRPAAPRPLNRLSAEPDIGPVLDAPAKKPVKEPADNVKPTLHEQVAAKPREPEVTDKKVTHIHLHPLHTCGMDFDHAPGDDGLSILIEPQNAANQYVPLAAPISVVVLDASKSGDAARLARWDFSEAEAAEKLVQGDKRGVHLKLPWPAKPPAGAQLSLFVRYETPEGKKLQGDKEIFVALPGQFSQRWTPRPADRPRTKPEPTVAAKASEPRVAVAPSQPLAIEPPEEHAPPQKEPPKITPPAGLSERQPGEKTARPKWSPTR
jgi:hypothetical protein